MTLIRTFTMLLAGAALAVSSGSAWAAPVEATEIRERTERLPKRAEGVDVEEHLGERTPMALVFQDEQGRDVLYGEATRGEVPTILTMNYSDCPMLCSLQLNALVTSLSDLDLTLGKDFRIVTVSLDPKETPDRLRSMKARYLSQYGRPEARSDGWTFLRGSDENIRAVARALGISYNYNEARDEYVHPAVFLIANPDGTIGRYLYGLEYHPKTVRLSLVEASQGKVGSTMDRLILFCFHYDASEGRYAPVARNIMKVGGAVTATSLAGLLLFLFRGERRRRSPSSHGSGPSGRGPASKHGPSSVGDEHPAVT